ncbi:hypothetical protein Tco_0517811 [Tanacetum coccineum]
MVLRVEKKLFVIEQPIFPAPPADSKYLFSEMRYMMLIMRLLVLCSEEGRPVVPYVIKMKNYVAQLERLGYVLPQDLSIGLILNGLTSDFDGFVRNYNMHNMGKTIGELHALLIEYEKGLPKKAATPQVMAIQGETATRILNMVSTKKVDKTPYELWYGKVPNLSYLKVWGCEETMGYYFYFSPENKIVVARHAELLKKNRLTQEINGRAKELEEIQDEDT